MVDFASPVLLAKLCLWKSSFLIEKLTVAELVRKYLFVTEPEVHHCVHQSPPLFPQQVYPIHTLAISYLYKPFQHYLIICTHSYKGSVLQIAKQDLVFLNSALRVCARDDSFYVLNVTNHFQQSRVLRVCSA